MSDQTLENAAIAATPKPEMVADYLMTLPGMLAATPCRVTIGKESFPAARYTQRLPIAPGCPAYARGEREHVITSIYVAGMVPNQYKRTSHLAFTIEGDSRDWYIACYAGAIIKRRQNTQAPAPYHPFGNSFVLKPWDLAERIDHFERKPYARIPLTIS